MRFRALQQLFKWLLDEGEIDDNPMARVKVPHVPEKPVPVLERDEIDRLFAACAGPGFAERRDTAIIHMLYDTGVRRAELANLTLADVDLDDRVAWVVGKGRRPRACPFEARTAKAIDRYLRARAAHADADALWLGHIGPMTDNGVGQMLRRRGRQAGVKDLHAHRFRHTFAHEWLAAGGQEADLMRILGWKSAQMVRRYGASATDERARDAYRRIRRGARPLDTRRGR